MLERLAHIFIPRQSNNQKAKVLHLTSLNLITAFLIFYQTFISVVPALGPKILGYAANISVDEVVRLTNEKRAAAGLAPLSVNEQLAEAALAKGNHMINFDYWAHVAPDGTEPWKFFRDAGYSYKYAGENLARDFTNAGAAVEAWMASPTHRDNMLSPKYREIGIAVVEGDLGGADTTVIVQLFGTALADTLPVEPVAAVQTTQPTAVAALALATPTPTPVAVIAQAAPSAAPRASNILISPFNATKSVSLVVIGVLLLALLADGIIIGRRKIHRVGGRSLAHLGFLGMILAIIIVAKVGSIL